ncbi:serine/threonine protein kinase [Mycobacterium asiaticum]|uniref:non-specific serine/threonine protein kinase n=1 Tax=Mycobacterium asiaticum TaxID=1790 RepID=A0A1A3P611_MYCAS|nr:serine/threonine-protein kinase [Mycobacterium asiaticum]OBK29673.1 serine/threonine protein kinase [Mycobacterium asiaticum]
MALASGATFAGYTVVRMLSSSASGELYLAQRSELPGWQALKVLPFALWVDNEFRGRFHRETEIATSLYHPNIVEVHERGEHDGQLWIAADYVEGTDAAALMANRFPAVLPVGEVLAIVTAAASGLDFAHQRGLLHRDVRPANILLTTAGAGEPRILLSDFGLVRPPSESAYAALEELAAKSVDGRADQYALATTAMHLFTGAPPTNSNRAKLSDLRPDLAHLDAVLARALADDPAERFGNCREFATALAEQAGFGGNSPEIVEQRAPAFQPYALDYPAYGWPETPPPAQRGPAPVMPPRGGTLLQSAAGSLARRLEAFSARGRPSRKWGPRRILLAAIAALVLVGLFAAGITIGRKTHPSDTRADVPATSVPAAPSTSNGAAPVVLDGTYRIEVQRSRQTFDNSPTPQPPDVETWWAIRSSCTPSRCLAAATLLDDTDHEQEKSPDVRPLIFEFGDGQWRSRPETVKFPCVGPSGAAAAQLTTQVLTLRPQPHGDLVGQMTVTVKSNECSQAGGVIRIPTMATRSGDLPPAVNVPDPVTLDPGGPATTSVPVTPETPSTKPSGPGR